MIAIKAFLGPSPPKPSQNGFRVRFLEILAVVVVFRENLAKWQMCARVRGVSPATASIDARGGASLPFRLAGCFNVPRVTFCMLFCPPADRSASLCDVLSHPSSCPTHNHDERTVMPLSANPSRPRGRRGASHLHNRVAGRVSCIDLFARRRSKSRFSLKIKRRDGATSPG